MTGSASDKAAPAAATDSVVCYCFNRNQGQLREAHARLGSLAAVQKETRVGSKCGGCRLILENMFGENPEEILNLGGRDPARSNLCVRPGRHVMKGFVAANHRLDTVIYSSNAVPPQFGAQDSSIPVEYMLLDMAGKPVIHRSKTFRTHETFCFDTRKEPIPRPFYGMFLFAIGRANYGASRFNTVWTNGISTCSTHEINDSGRPSTVLPVMADAAFLAGPNRIHLAMQNPHAHAIRVMLHVFDVKGAEAETRYRDMAPHTTEWIDVSRTLYAPALADRPGGQVFLRIQAEPRRVENAPTLYFFIHNLETDIWSANHL
jgi:bacterioferritin-associated ferredoxin